MNLINILLFSLDTALWVCRILTQIFTLISVDLLYGTMFSKYVSLTTFHVAFQNIDDIFFAQGEKVFYLIPPTEINLNLYQKWMTTNHHHETFFGDKVNWQFLKSYTYYYYVFQVYCVNYLQKRMVNHEFINVSQFLLQFF